MESSDQVLSDNDLFVLKLLKQARTGDQEARIELEIRKRGGLLSAYLVQQIDEFLRDQRAA